MMIKKIILLASIFAFSGQTFSQNKLDDYRRLSKELSGSNTITSRPVSELEVIIEFTLSDPNSFSKEFGSLKSIRTSIIKSLDVDSYSGIVGYDNFPLIALRANQKALNGLLKNNQVKRIYRNSWKKTSDFNDFNKPSLFDSSNIIQADRAWSNGYDGTGQVVAVLDTGVRKSHDMFAGKVIREACFSTNDPRFPGIVVSSCPNGLNTQYGDNSALPPWGVYGYTHGTHVAGIAVGDRKLGQPNADGVARGAKLIAVNVFTRINNNAFCDGHGSCLAAADSDVIRGLDYIYNLRNNYSIASVNLSLGSGLFSTHCDTSSVYTSVVNRLYSAGIATVAASGNNGANLRISEPACVSKVIAVGSTDKQLNVSDFSNGAPILDMLAPGKSIYSAWAYDDVGYAPGTGTSMAAPHIAGAIAVLKAAMPDKSLAQIESIMKSKGRNIFCSKCNGNKPLVQLLAALNLPSDIVPIITLLLLSENE